MGLVSTKIWQKLFGNQGIRILMTGLDSAGKTTILYKLNLGKVVTNMPIIALNIEEAENRNISLTVFDATSHDEVRLFWRYYGGFEGLVFAVDSSDRYRIDIARETLHMVINEEQLRDAPVLVLANKQDFPNAMTIAEVSNRLRLSAMRGKTWLVIGTCATNGDGLHEGLDWLSSVL